MCLVLLNDLLVGLNRMRDKTARKLWKAGGIKNPIFISADLPNVAAAVGYFRFTFSFFLARFIFLFWISYAINRSKTVTET